MRQLRLELEKKQAQVEPRIRLARIAMKEAVLSAQPNRSVFEKNIRAITDLQLEMKMNMLDHWFKVFKILTPEQQKVWKDHVGDGLMMDGDGPKGMRRSPDGPHGRGPRGRG